MAKIEHDIQIRAPKDAVFRALSTEAGVRGWWNHRARISPEVGGESTYQFNKAGSDVHMRFRNETLDEQAGKVVWACVANDNTSWIDTKIRWSIEERNGGARVELVHDGFAEAFADTEGYRMVSGGWQHFLNSLKAWTEDGKGQPYE